MKLKCKECVAILSNVMHRSRRPLKVGFVITAAILASAPALAGDDLTNMKLEDLMNLRVQVISAAKRPQRLADAAAAIYVLTDEDIRRSGARSVPEVLRLVPGMIVARLNNGEWAISARGSASSVANKLLVLVDGRSIYSPLFGGVLWDLQDFLLQDIERVEVIRGPGATLWGANAVNGVINIITKSADNTQGAFVSVGSGSVERGYVEARYGGKLSDDTALRISAKYADWKSTMSSADAGHFQAPYVTRSVGFRSDSVLNGGNSLMMSGQLTSNIYGDMEVVPLYVAPYSMLQSYRYNEGSAHFNTKWSHIESDTSDYSIRLSYSYEHAARNGDTGWTNSVELEFQDRLSPLEFHDVVWGLAYKANFMHIGTAYMIVPDQNDARQSVISGFVQDDISLVASRLHTTIGTKVEYNDFSGFDLEPSLRLIWTPDSKNSLWAAISRAARTPTMAEEYTTYLQGVIANPYGTVYPPIALKALSSKSFQSETTMAYEAGYRTEILDNISFDLALFYNSGTKLRSGITLGQGFSLTPVPNIIQYLQVTNIGSAHSYGLELAAEWQPIQGWRLQGTYSYLNGQARQNGKATSSAGYISTLGQIPHNQFTVRSLVDLPHNIEGDVSLRYVGALYATEIGSYAAIDARLGWKPVDGIDLSVVGQNLIGPSHTEFSAASDSIAGVAAQLGRTVFVKASLTF